MSRKMQFCVQKRRVHQSELWKWRMTIAANFPIWGSGKKKPEKNQGFNGVQTRDLREYRCDALSTELWSHTLGGRSIYWVHISREEWNDVKNIWNNSYLNCGCRCKWRMIIAVNFPIWAIGKKKPDHSTLSSTTAVQIWIISYILHVNQNCA